MFELFYLIWSFDIQHRELPWMFYIWWLLNECMFLGAHKGWGYQRSAIIRCLSSDLGGFLLFHFGLPLKTEWVHFKVKCLAHKNKKHTIAEIKIIWHFGTGQIQCFGLQESSKELLQEMLWPSKREMWVLDCEKDSFEVWGSLSWKVTRSTWVRASYRDVRLSLSVY